MVQLPSATLYGCLTWQIIRAVADGVDEDDYPDAAVFSGLKAVFTPSITLLKDLSVPVTIQADPVTAEFDDEGFLRTPGGSRGVWLLATDSPNLAPQGITWTVKLTGAAVDVTIRNLVILGGTTTDLTTDLATSGGMTRLVILIPTADPTLVPPVAVDGDLVMAIDTGELYAYNAFGS